MKLKFKINNNKKNLCVCMSVCTIVVQVCVQMDVSN